MDRRHMIIQERLSVFLMMVQRLLLELNITMEMKVIVVM